MEASKKNCKKSPTGNRGMEKKRLLRFCEHGCPRGRKYVGGKLVKAPCGDNWRYVTVGRKKGTKNRWKRLATHCHGCRTKVKGKFAKIANPIAFKEQNLDENPEMHVREGDAV